MSKVLLSLVSEFWVSFPSLSYRDGPFPALGRLFHQSSHVGDEYLLRGGVDRENLSYEALSLTLSYDLYDMFRIYGGAAYLFHRDPSDIEPWGAQFGCQFESPRRFLNNRVRPLAAIDIQHHEEVDWDANFSVRLGVRFETEKTAERRYQIMLHYYEGHVPAGQFNERKIETLGLGLDFYF